MKEIRYQIFKWVISQSKIYFGVFRQEREKGEGVTEIRRYGRTDK